MQYRVNQKNGPLKRVQSKTLSKKRTKTQLAEHLLCPGCFSVLLLNQSKVTLTPLPCMKYIKYKYIYLYIYMYTVYAGPFHIPKYNPMKQILDFFFFFSFLSINRNLSYISGRTLADFTIQLDVSHHMFLTFLINL